MNRFTAFDVETATFEASSICQIGIVVYEDGEELYHFQSKVRPPDNLYHWRNIQVHGIETSNTASSPTFGDLWPSIRSFFEGQVVVAHNIGFDYRCLVRSLHFYGLEVPEFTRQCTLKIYKRGLSTLAKQYGIALNHHDALSDARACGELYARHLRGKEERRS